MVANDSVVRVFPVVLWIHREEANFRGLGVNAVCAQNLARRLGLFGGLVVGVFGFVGLGRDVELDERGIRRGFKFAIGADENGVGQRAERGTLRDRESAQNENGAKGNNDSFHREILLPLDGLRFCLKAA